MESVANYACDVNKKGGSIVIKKQKIKTNKNKSRKKHSITDAGKTGLLRNKLKKKIINCLKKITISCQFGKQKFIKAYGVKKEIRLRLSRIS